MCVCGGWELENGIFFFVNMVMDNTEFYLYMAAELLTDAKGRFSIAIDSVILHPSIYIFFYSVIVNL